MKTRLKRALALVVVFAMLLGLMQTSYGADTAAQGRASVKASLEAFDGYELIDQSVMKADSSASSYQDPEKWNDGGPELAFDGNAGSAWHTNYEAAYTPATPENPHYIEFGLGEECKVGKIAITPKDGGNNGYVKDVNVYAKTGDAEFAKVKTVSLTREEAESTYYIELDDVTADRLKIEVSDSYNENSQKLVCIGEINVYKKVEGEVETPDYDATDDYTVTIVWEDEDNLAGARPNSWGIVLQNAKTKEQKTLTPTTSPGPLKNPTVINFKNIPRYNQDKTKAEWEVKPGLNTAIGYDITVEKTGDTSFTVTLALEHKYEDKTVSINWVNGDSKNRPEVKVQLQSQKSSIYKPAAQGEAIILNEENGYSYTWEDVLTYPKSVSRTQYLPIYGIAAIEGMEGYEISYNVEENSKGNLEFDESGNIIITCEGEKIAEDVLEVNVNGTALGGDSLESILSENSIEAQEVTSLEFLSGTITNGDVEYLKDEKNLSNVVSIKMNLSDHLSLLDSKGESSTVLPASIFQLYKKLQEVELNGFTEIGDSAFSTASELTNVVIPNAVKIGSNAFRYAYKLADISLPEVTDIGKQAFFECVELANVDMPKIVNIGEDAFRNTDKLTTLHLPESIESIGTSAFSVDNEEPRKVWDVTIDKTTPPSVSDGFYRAVAGASILHVPAGSLPNYVKSGVDVLQKQSDSNFKWSYLRIEDPDYYYLTYQWNRGEGKYSNCYVLKGQPLGENAVKTSTHDKAKVGYTLDGYYLDAAGTGEKLSVDYVPEDNEVFYAQWRDYFIVETSIDGTVTEIAQKDVPIPLSEGYTLGDQMPEDPVKEGHGFKGWYTDAEGTGDPVTAETVFTTDVILYAVFEEEAAPVVTVLINGSITASGDSLADAIEKAEVASESVVTMEILSGTVTAADIPKDLKDIFPELETFKLNLEEGVRSYVDKDGKVSTKFPARVFEEHDKITTVELGGFEEISSSAFNGATALESVKIDDALQIGQSAFSGAKSLQSISLPKVTTISSRAFSRCTSLTEVSMPVVKTIREGAFLGSGYLNITLPASLKELHYGAFGIADSIDSEPGEEVEFHVVMEGQTPPNINMRYGRFPFLDASPTSTLEVPEGCEDAYLSSENGNAEKRTWCDLPLKSDEPVINLTVKIGTDEANAQEVSGASLEDIVGQAGTSAYKFKYLEFVSGLVRNQDLTYMKDNLSGIQDVKLNLKEGLIYEVGGVASTVLQDEAFRVMSALKTVELAGFTEIGESAFGGTQLLTSVYIPDVQTIGAYAFLRCRELKEVQLPSVTEIKNSAFSNSGVEKVEMPVIKTIGSMAFQNTGYTEIHLPASLERLNYKTFGYSKAEEGQLPLHVTMDRTTPPVTGGYDNVFFNAPADSTLTVPEGAEDAYLNSIYGDREAYTWLGLKLTKKEPVSATVTFKTAGNGCLIDAEGNECWVSDPIVYADVSIGTEVNVPETKGSKGTDYYEFAYWKNSAGEKVELGETVVAEKDETYTAYFERGTYTVTFVVEDTRYGMFNINGDLVGQTETTVTGKKEVKFPQGSRLEAVTNCEFVTWKDENGKEISYTSTTPQKDTTYTAVFGPKSSLSGMLYKVVDKETGEILKSTTGADIGGSFKVRINEPYYIMKNSSALAKLEAIGYELDPSEQTAYEFVYSDLNTYTLNGQPVELNDIKKDYVVFTASKKEVPLAVEVTYSNEGNPTNKDIVVTLAANKAIEDLEGWTRLSDTELAKVHSKNGTYEVTVTSVDGESVTVSYEVTGIDKQAPSIKVGGEEGQPSYYRAITSIAVHDTVGLAKLDINGTETLLGDKYHYFDKPVELGIVEGENRAIVTDKAGNKAEVTFHYDITVPTFEFVVDNSKLEASKVAQLITSEEIVVPEGWTLISSEEGRYVYEKNFTSNWKDKAFTVTDLAGNVSEPQFVEVKRVENSTPTATFTQDITDWTKNDVTVTMKTSVDCQTPEGWTKVDKRTFTRVISESGTYTVILTSATGINSEELSFEVTNIDKEAPVIDYNAISAAGGYNRTIDVNKGDEYTNEELVEMFTKAEWVTDNSGTAKFSVDTWGLENGLDGYAPFTSKKVGSYKVRFYAKDAAGNQATFDVFVKVVDSVVPTASFTQDITDWTNKDVTVTMTTSTPCETPEGWTKVDDQTFTKVIGENGTYTVILTSDTGVVSEELSFEITNIDKEAPAIRYDAISAAGGYSRTIEVNEGNEYTHEELVKMFTKATWVTDNSGTAKFVVDGWVLDHGATIDSVKYDPFTSKAAGTYVVRFYAKDAAGNQAVFDVFVTVVEKEEVEETLTTTIHYTIFIDNGEMANTDVIQDQYVYTGTETGDMTFDLSMVKGLPEEYQLAEGETGYRVLKYGETTAFTFCLEAVNK